MPRRPLSGAVILLALAPSCSDAERPGASDAAATGAATTGTVGSGGATSSTTGGAEGGSSAEGGGPSSGSGGSGGSGGDGGGSSPPASATLCGQGSFTKNEAIQACNAENTSVVMLPPAHCDLLGIDGGAWEAWCSSTSLVYFWIRFDGAATLERGMEVVLEGGLPAMLIELSGDAKTWTGQAPNTPAYASKLEKDITLDWDLSDLPMAMPAGSGHLWVTGMHTNHTSIFDQVLVSGATFDWAVP
jgi:hypothetical protein